MCYVSPAFIEKGEDITDLRKLTPQEQLQMEQQMSALSKTMARNAEKDSQSSSQLQEYQVAFDKLKVRARSAP